VQPGVPFPSGQSSFLQSKTNEAVYFSFTVRAMQCFCSCS
jgi:hypothetical protein